MISFCYWVGDVPRAPRGLRRSQGEAEVREYFEIVLEKYLKFVQSSGLILSWCAFVFALVYAMGSVLMDGTQAVEKWTTYRRPTFLQP